MDDLTAQTTTPDAGAVPSTSVAGQEGNFDSQTAGAVPATSVAGQEGGQEAGTPPSQEGAEGATEGEQSISKPANIRIEELATRVKEYEAKNQAQESKIQQMEARLAEREQAQAAETPNFINIDYDRLNSHLKQQIARENQIREDIALDPDNASAELLAELFQIQHDREQLIGEVRQNETQRAEYLRRQQENAQNQAYHREVQTRIDNALTLLKEQEKVPEDVFKAGRDFFNNACRGNKFLQQQFDETIMLKGPAAAVLFAWDYVKSNMGKKQEALIQQKEEAKQTLPPGKTTTAEVVGSPELDALRKKAETSGNIEDIAAYSAAKKRASAQ